MNDSMNDGTAVCNFCGLTINNDEGLSMPEFIQKFEDHLMTHMPAGTTIIRRPNKHKRPGRAD